MSFVSPPSSPLSSPPPSSPSPSSPSPVDPDRHLVTTFIYWRECKNISKFPPYNCIFTTGIRLHTLAVAYDIFGKFNLSDMGRKRIQESAGDVGLSVELMSFISQTIATVTDEGLLMIAVYGSLMKLYSLENAAEVFNQMHGDFDRRSWPSLAQWKLLLEPFSSLNLYLIVIRAHAIPHLGGLKVEQVPSFHFTPASVAKALLALGKLSRGQLQSVTMTGGAIRDLCYIAAVGELLFDLSIRITDSSGVLFYPNCSDVYDVRGYTIQLSLVFDPMQLQLQIDAQDHTKISNTNTVWDSSEDWIYATEEDVPFRRDTTAMEGRGTFGIVYKATTSHSNEVFAVKRLDKVYGPKKRAIVHKEFELLKQCSHPNLLRLMQVYQVATLRNVFFLVTSPWAPDTLHDFINLDDHQRESVFPWYNEFDFKSDFYIYHIFHGLADGLSYLHNTGIKHKDIKPSNLLLFRELEPDLKKISNSWGVRPIIADLGVSKLLKPDSSTNFTHSTFDYLAPEQVHHVDSTPKSDVFAMGCCFANILAIWCAGSKGRENLLDAIEEDSRSCQYARELDHVEAALEYICFKREGKRRDVLALVQSMLKAEPSERPNSYEVRDFTSALEQSYLWGP